ncbi:MAG: S8 family serine peptidase [Planctomycetes bacterium]|nr:S8 family serine peptidase [Planctomycetota bacterium]
MATAQQQGGKDLATEIVPSGYGLDTFLIESPDAASSAASRLNGDRVEPGQTTPAPTEGYVLSNQVVVQTDDLELLVDMSREVDENALIKAHALDGFYIVEVQSVVAAIEMTWALEPLFGKGLVHLDVERPISHRLPNDPRFSNQWHLRNTQRAEADANVEDAWAAGYTGNGVVVGVIDGGVQTGHEDLAANYNSTASLSGRQSSHGTAVAGVIAAVEGNNKGGVGAAYDAQWSKLYYGSSSYTATNFLHRNDINDIKNNSWGPYDDGTIWTISNVEKNALADSVANGRGGLGEIFTWAAGNGGAPDRVDYDPYASSRYTIAVGAIGDRDVRSSYNEKGSSMLVVSHSNGNSRGIDTTDLNGYTTSFGGTSSSAPLGAGVVALMLDANPSLTWRDVQHVLVHSARKCDPNQSNWSQNGSGHDINYNYGFGAADAGAATALAATWNNVSAEQVYNSGTINYGQQIPDNDENGLQFNINVPDNFTIEHVELILNVDHNTIGDLRIRVTSPAGTKSAFTVPRGDTKNDLNDYIFTSVRSWDEESGGDWTFFIADERGSATGTLIDYKLKIYGNDGSHLGDTFRVVANNLIAGQTATIDVASANPSELCWRGYSLTGLGSYPVPPLGITMDIDSPVQLGNARTTSVAGDASWTPRIPANATGAQVWFQAVQLGNKSSVLPATIQ